MTSTAHEGLHWIIRRAGTGRYTLKLGKLVVVVPCAGMTEIKVPDATPVLVEMYTLGDEQALLAKLRCNRLVDMFIGIACYSLHNHLRTTVPGVGQVEVDELYVGTDERGAHFVLPVQAKGAREQLGIIQVEQDLALCAARFPALVCRPIGAQFMRDDLISLFEFSHTDAGVRISRERHYRLVPPGELSDDDLAEYRKSLR